MKDITTITDNAIGSYKAGEDVFAKTKSKDLTDNQKTAVKYFFERLHRIYQSEYRRNIPDESTERAIKGEFAHLIMDIPKPVMDRGFDALHDEIKVIDSQYKFMKLDAVIELVKTGGNVHGVHDGAYKVLPRALPVPEEIRSKRKQKGIEGCKKILNIFGE
jgi:hypothetical protein